MEAGRSRQGIYGASSGREVGALVRGAPARSFFIGDLVRAFVTGGTGFIGGRMVERLLGDGWDVAALVRAPERAARIRDLGATLVPGDVTQPETFCDAMKGAGAVFHLAAYYALGVSDRDQMMRINVGGTEAVLRAAGEASVPRIVYCSSIAALGSGPHGSVGDETREHHGDFPSIYEE